MDVSHSRQNAPDPQEKFRRLLSTVLSEAVKRGGGPTSAAKRLGISRAILYRYLTGDALPSAFTLWRACAEWGIVLDSKGLRRGRASTPPRKSGDARADPIQMRFGFMEERLPGKRVNLVVTKKTNAKEINVRLKIRVAG